MNGIFKKIRAKLVKDKHSAITVDSKPIAVQGSNPKSKLAVVLATSVGITGLIIGARHLHWLQPLELAAYDQMLRSRPANKIDNRLLVVTVTEEDFQSFGNPLPTTTINKLLVKLESYQPRVIGLNIYRPSEKGVGASVTDKSKLIVACKFRSLKNSEIPPPLGFPSNNIGFNDLIPDSSDRTVRRALLFGNSGDKKCNAEYSFAALVSLNYLEKQGIQSRFENETWVLGGFVIPRLQGKPGSYEDFDSRGYQILLNYRHPDSLARQVTLTQVLNNQINPEWVKDKLVIIGNTASSIDRGISTPYGALPNQPGGTPGTLIQAQIVSNILSTVLDNKPIISYWSDFTEIGWVWFWALVGGAVGWRFRNPLMFLVASGTSLGALLGICYFLFLQALWIPVVPSAMALLITGIGVMAYSAYRTEIETKIIIIQVEKQQEAIAQLSALLKEPTRISDTQLRADNFADTPPQRNAGDFLLSGRYQITRVLGSGGFGSTYVAKDTQRPGDPTCVVKQLMPARRDTRFMEVARRLFDAEAEILLILGKHGQIPDLLAYFEENNEFYLVEEYIKGQTLGKELSACDTQDEEYVIEMLKSVLQVLKFVHEHRVIHRDIKPDNIIRNSQDNNLVLIDFGAVKKMQPPSNETELATVAIGTRGYAAPEQLAGHPRLSSDIYALGMIGIQALTGVPPQALEINPDTGNVEWRHLVTVSDKLAHILDKMVCYHFNERYQSAAEVLEDLSKL